jgi:hypothetical protein
MMTDALYIVLEIQPGSADIQQGFISPNQLQRSALVGPEGNEGVVYVRVDVIQGRSLLTAGQCVCPD